MSETAARADSDSGLHLQVLSDLRVFGQSVGGIGPTIGAVALVPPLVGAASGAGWLTVVIGTLGVLAVGVCLTIMARHHATSGGLYNLNTLGLGRWAGFLTASVVIAGVTLILPLCMIGVAQALAAFANTTGIATHTGPGAMFVIELITVAVGAATAYLEIRMSTSMFLIIEGISMAAIVALLIVILAKSPTLFDHAQLTLQGISAHGILVDIAIMSLVFLGFEGATSLGFESRKPARAIPIALLGAVATVGVFDTVNAYVQTLGFTNIHRNLASSAEPLTVLAQHYNVSALGDIVSLGLAFSWFAALVTWFVYGPRVLLTMARENVLPRAFAHTSKQYGSPDVGVGVWLATSVVIAIWIYAPSNSLDNAFGGFALFTGLCGTAYYFLAAAAAIGWAYRRRDTRTLIAATAAGACGMAIMGIGFYFAFVPLPTFPMRGYIIAFWVVAAVGVALYGALRWLQPKRVSAIGTEREDLTAATTTTLAPDAAVVPEST